MKKSYAISIIFGAAPLVIGTFIFALWYFTRIPILEMAGVFTIIGGLVSILIATIGLIVYLCRQSKSGNTGKVLLKKGLIPAIIIISNFPVAFFCSNVAINIMTQYVLTIENNSPSLVSNVIVTAPGINEHIESIKPNAKIKLKLDFKGDGVLEFKAKQNAIELGGTVEGYVTGGIGGTATLVFKNNGQYEIIQD